LDNRNQYHFYRKELRSLFRNRELNNMAEDIEVIDRLLNLLTEGKAIGKIKGIISTSQIVKYGGDISNENVDIIYEEIIDWWKAKN
jgi:hypothetical protein